MEKSKEKLVQVNISNIKVYDLNNQEVLNTLAKDLANVIYTKTSNLDWLNRAMSMNKGQSIMLTELEVREMRMIINHPACDLTLAQRDALNKYVENILGEFLLAEIGVTLTGTEIEG